MDQDALLQNGSWRVRSARAGRREPTFLYDWERSNYNMLASAERMGRAFGTPNLKGIGCRVRKATGSGRHLDPREKNLINIG